jgi:hypothetical protein
MKTVLVFLMAALGFLAGLNKVKASIPDSLQVPTIEALRASEAGVPPARETETSA